MRNQSIAYVRGVLTIWFEVLTRDFWGQPMADSDSHKSFRPVTTLTYRANSVLFGMSDTTSFHVVNVLLHGMTSALTVPVPASPINLTSDWSVSLVIGQWFVGSYPTHLTRWLTPRDSQASNAVIDHELGSALVGMLFAAHPIHAEAVSNITGPALGLGLGLGSQTSQVQQLLLCVYTCYTRDSSLSQAVLSSSAPSSTCLVSSYTSTGALTALSCCGLLLGAG